MEKQLSKGKLFGLVFFRLILGIPVLMAMFILPAGTWNYWEAWVYMGVLFIPMFLVLIYLLINSPELLERRLQMRERETKQSRIIQISILYFLVVFLMPGFDKRFGWSQASVVAVIVADILVLLGYSIFFLVLRENRYAARTIQVEQDQQVIRSGPYALVRHPMYLGMMILTVFSPLALGSYWAVIPGLAIIPILVARIINEETLLAKELTGYTEYMQQTRYRLIPGVW